MLSSEENAGTVSECLPEMFVVHSPVDGSITDETSEHSQSQSKNVTVISTSDDRKGNDEKKSGSSARAVREKGSAKNRAISTPRPLQNSENFWPKSGLKKAKFWQILQNFAKICKKKQQKFQQFLTKILRLENGAKECIV